MTTVAVINRKSGTALGFEPGALEDLLGRAFAGAGLEVDLQFVEPEEIDEALEQAARESDGLFIAGGGDGTINTAACHAIAHDKTLGILPMGTLNRLAHDLRLPLELADAAQLIGTCEPRRIDAAEVNGEIFFCNSFFGLPALFAEVRAEIRGARLLSRMRRYLFDFPRAAFRARRIAVTVNDDAKDQTIRGLAFAISNNPYDEDTLLTLQRGTLDSGELGFYATKHYSAPAVLFLLVRIMFGRWDADPQFVRTRAKKIKVRTPHKHLKLTNDGELMRMETPLTYRIRPRALSVVAPP